VILRVVLGAFLLGLFARPATADRKERLDQIRHEIEKRESKARTYAEKAKGYFQELDGLDRQLVETRRSRRRLRRRRQTAEEELKAAKVGVEKAAHALGVTRKSLEVRLVALYKFQSVGGLPALWVGRDFQSFSRVRRALGRVLQQDGVLFEQHRSARAAWVRSREQSRQLLEEISEAQKEIDTRNDRVRKNSVERHNLVALLRSRAEQEKRAADELRAAASKLEQTLRTLPAEGRSEPGHGLHRGQVVWPVKGPVRLGFGRQIDPEFGTRTRRSGIEIDAPRGREVQAVEQGRVLFAGWFRGYGQLVILDHGEDCVSVSGYLEELFVKKGDRVRKGDKIGTIGEAGSLSGPGLYFEIRRHGRPEDPQAWLGSR